MSASCVPSILSTTGMSLNLSRESRPSTGFFVFTPSEPALLSFPSSTFIPIAANKTTGEAYFGLLSAEVLAGAHPVVCIALATLAKTSDVCFGMLASGVFCFPKHPLYRPAMTLGAHSTQPRALELHPRR